MAEITLTLKQAQAVFDALDIGLDAAGLEAANFHEAMKGYREAEHKRLDDDAWKVNAALTFMGQLIEDATPQPQPASPLDGGAVAESQPVVGPSGSDWEAVGGFRFHDYGGWQQVASEYANDPDVTKLYRKRAAHPAPAQLERDAAEADGDSHAN